jgi:dihydrofolate reductase
VEEEPVRKIIVMMSVSLDGYFEGPDHDLSWHAITEELHSEFNDVLRPMSAFLDGRVMHEMMAEYWPTADEQPGATQPEIEFSRIWREMPKVVYSRTLEKADWNTTIVREVVPDEVRAMKARPGGDMALGGADLAATFMEHDLIDEYRLYVHPLVLGSGRRLFPDGPRIPLRLVETRPFGNGVVLTRFQRG